MDFRGKGLQKVTVIRVNEKSPLRRTEAYWGGPKGDSYIDQGEIDETRRRIARLSFPCRMDDTGQRDMFGKRILVDEFGVKWSEGHFDIA